MLIEQSREITAIKENRGYSLSLIHIFFITSLIPSSKGYLVDEIG